MPGAPTRQATTPARATVPVLWGAVATGTAVLALLAAGGAPVEAPSGLPDAGPVVGWTLRLARLAVHVTSLVVVGALLTALLADRPLRRGLITAAAAAWAAAAATTLVLGLSESVGRPVQEVLAADLLSSYVREMPQGTASAVSGLLALCLAGAVWVEQADTRAGAAVALGTALVALTPPLLTAHAATGGIHRLTQALVVVHVVAAVLWVGGLGGLALLRGSAVLPSAAGRFSPLALGCAVAVAITGTASAGLRLGWPEPHWTSGYGALVAAKALALTVLVAAGAVHRRHTLPLLAQGRDRAFRRLAVGEVTVMAVAVGLAVALARTPPPM